jgi:WD40-like Beta Propeller Repeat
VKAWAPLFILIALSACGGGGADQPAPGLATVSTLAYVVNECSTDAARGPGTIRQRLQIRRGDQPPITVVDTSVVGFTNGDFCGFIGLLRADYRFLQYGVFHRLGVSPDGSQVVFEVTDFTESPGPSHVLSDEQKGIFAVRSDGTGLRSLGPASRESSLISNGRPFFVFSPNGRTIAYTDRGPSRNDEDAIQIFTLDLVTGTRTQLTELPPTVSRGTYNPLFNNDQTIAFFTHA